ncbi:MAG: DMT family transporter, partial [Bacilli bacterium]|nr:DMT family transporter [Bacilli bacterium]
MSKKNKLGIHYGILSGMFWGLDTVLTGFVLSATPFISTEKAILIAPIISAFLHDIFSSIWMMLFLGVKKELIKTIKLLKTKSARYVALASLFGGPIGMGGYLLAISYLGPGYTASISAVYPAVGAFFAYIFLKEKLSIKGWLGLLISIVAIIILGYAPGESVNSKFALGFIFALVCVLGWSLESVICAYGMKDDEINPEQALQIRQLVSGITYGIIIIPIISGIEL